mgnify:CR=1 FL=1
MLNHILKFSIQHRWLVLMLSMATAAIGFFSLLKLPIDAVPDISSKIVQVTTVYPSLSPAEVEKQIAFPIETAMAGIRWGMNTSCSTNVPNHLPRPRELIYPKN